MHVRYRLNIMTSSNGNIFRVTVKGQRRGALMFSFICVWKSGLANNREAGDLKRHHAHYDAIVMNWYRLLCICVWNQWSFAFSEKKIPTDISVL